MTGCITARQKWLGALFGTIVGLLPAGVVAQTCQEKLGMSVCDLDEAVERGELGRDDIAVVVVYTTEGEMVTYAPLSRSGVNTQLYTVEEYDIVLKEQGRSMVKTPSAISFQASQGSPGCGSCTHHGLVVDTCN